MRADGRTNAAPGWMTWRNTVVLAAAVLVLRVVYLVWFCGWELLGDEAYYWQWSRHLDLCYYEKGPGIAYLIAASTALFGVSEWAVRLPMAVTSALATLALARLAMACSKGDERVGFVAAAVFTLMPAYQGNAQVCTPDGPFIACWILGSWAGWRLVDAIERGRAAAFAWIAFGAALGLGFLFKQSMLLLAPGVLLYALVRYECIRWNGRLAGGALAALLGFAVFISPILIWNHRHHWPTLAHTLGHVGVAGGDRDVSGAWSYNPGWTLGLIAAQVVAFGPPVFVLMVPAIRRAVRARRETGDVWPAQCFLVCCAAPSLALYLLVTIWKRAEANWPFPAFATLLILAAQWLVTGLFSGTPKNPSPSAEGNAAQRPSPWLRVGWNGVVIYGVAGWLLLSFLPNLVAGLEWEGKDRLFGNRERAAKVAALVQDVESRNGPTPFLAAPHYQQASLYAFYLPGHPVVCNANSLMGGRATAYDFWLDTDLHAAALHGKSALLLGSRIDRWAQALRFESIAPLDDDVPAYLGVGYRGPAAD